MVNFHAREREAVLPAFHRAVDAFLSDPDAYRVLAGASTSPATPPVALEGSTGLRYETWNGKS